MKWVDEQVILECTGCAFEQFHDMSRYCPLGDEYDCTSEGKIAVVENGDDALGLYIADKARLRLSGG